MELWENKSYNSCLRNMYWYQIIVFAGILMIICTASLSLYSMSIPVFYHSYCYLTKPTNGTHAHELVLVLISMAFVSSGNMCCCERCQVLTRSVRLQGNHLAFDWKERGQRKRKVLSLLTGFHSPTRTMMM